MSSVPEAAERVTPDLGLLGIDTDQLDVDPREEEIKIAYALGSVPDLNDHRGLDTCRRLHSTRVRRLHELDELASLRFILTHADPGH